ncbi:type II toxin-antitoxin system VapC family toxin [Salinisphaera sp.]|uniref:type II toxin-antitoxin system VapC family toxin n=1 Tax=Salinisphaera sp. TaxID=1914330 RepID=UPI002D799BF5|nr:type II toxin-antitoxin system VapC family toxin [Salinisphaera sp.]HET7313041.1 type II toxin-antitoxin system VapC family toxin [Salinisphaera sp.]
MSSIDPVMANVVLDASAIIALIFDEPGGDRVEAHLPAALVSTVNIAEVATCLLALDMPAETVDTVIDTLQLSIQAFDYDQALATARLRSVTRSAGLSLGDRACLALAKARHARALTADRAWQEIAGDAAVDVELLR